MINNTEQYITLMKLRAEGALPDMGSALRLIDILKQDIGQAYKPIELLDVGCATGHYLQTFLKSGIRVKKYCGIDIDPVMVSEGQKIWIDKINDGSVSLINSDIDEYESALKFDYVFCMNAFMYFPKIRLSLEKMISLTRKRLLIRGYFTDSNYKIIRAQTKNNHDKSDYEELDIFDDEGNIRKYDLWNIYSFSYIEALIKSINPNIFIEWLDDNNVIKSIAAEKRLGIEKRGATELIDGQEISYPFILPWKYLSLTL